MLNPNEITADLPSPRDDEPENLRGDIRDELADHLHCAMRRELLSGIHGNNENAAWQNVLKRFGNPTRVALECWLIKMKGKLIMQKISLGISMAAVILCGVLVALMWKSMEASQQTNASMLDAQSKMLDKMDKLVQATLDNQNPGVGGGGFGGAPGAGFGAVPGGGFGGNPQNQPVINTTKDAQDWIPFKIKLVSGTKDGPPVVGQEVYCTGKFLGTTDESLKRVTDANGICDFGKVRVGLYTPTILMPWGDTIESARLRVSSEYQLETIVCPLDDKYHKVSFKFNVPDDLKDESLRFYINPTGLPLFGSRDFRNEDRDGTDRVTRSRFELDNYQWRINPFKEVRMFGFKANGDFNYNFIKGNDKYIPKSENLVANHLIVYYGDLEVVGLGNNHLTPIYAFLQKKKNEGVLETKANFLFNLDTKSVHELPPLSVSLYKKDSENPKSVAIDLQPDLWTAIRDGMVETKKVKPKADEATKRGRGRLSEE